MSFPNVKLYCNLQISNTHKSNGVGNSLIWAADGRPASGVRSIKSSQKGEPLGFGNKGHVLDEIPLKESDDIDQEILGSATKSFRGQFDADQKKYQMAPTKSPLNADEIPRTYTLPAALTADRQNKFKGLDGKA